MALASAGCEMSSSSYTAGPRSQLSGAQGCGLQNWRLWRLRRLCSVMAGGGGYFEITPFLPIFGHPSKYLKI